MEESKLLDEDGMQKTLERLAEELLAKHKGGRLALVGIHTRGVILAERLKTLLQPDIPQLEQGTLDISLYRDDLNNLAALPKVQGSDIPFDVEGAPILLCDDVLYTGRTIRAAMNLLLDYGRPQFIELAVLVDRGHRELPIAPTYCGVEVKTEREEYVRVHFQEQDGGDALLHFQKENS